MRAAAWYLDNQNNDQLCWHMYIQREELVEVLMLEEELGLMSYHMQSLN